MGNCQAAEAATVVIQHPGGRVERLYWPTTAEDIMKSNPGYHVAIVTLCIAQHKQQQQQQQQQQESSSSSDSRASGHVRFTRVRLLKPKDMLLIGQVYRLITSQEVNKALRARKHDKIKRTQSEMMRKQQSAVRVLVHEDTTEVGHDQRQEKQESTSSSSTTAAAANAARLRQWRPSLQSISESVI